jgi:hypothetical protein
MKQISYLTSEQLVQYTLLASRPVEDRCRYFGLTDTQVREIDEIITE